MNFYNEHDPKAAAWLRELIKAGEIPAGQVDERSISELTPNDLAGYAQCHFFAGIGGWSLALRLAGWTEDRPVWTGSCPCQPFSVAGRGLQTDDERHLWPDFRNLIGLCRPPIVIGEQVASAAGRQWLAGVSADLETLAYANCAADLCAAGVGAPHIRPRLFWMAVNLGCLVDAPGTAIRRESGNMGETQREDSRRSKISRLPGTSPVSSSQDGRMVHPGLPEPSGRKHKTRSGDRQSCHEPAPPSGHDRGMGQPHRAGRHPGQPPIPPAGHGQTTQPASGGNSGLPNSAMSRCDRTQQESEIDSRDEAWLRMSGADGRSSDSPADDRLAVTVGQQKFTTTKEGFYTQSGERNQSGFWSSYDIIPFRDGKHRRIEPGTFPLAHGVPGRVGLLRGYGNAIVPQLAAQFIQAATEAMTT